MRCVRLTHATAWQMPDLALQCSRCLPSRWLLQSPRLQASSLSGKSPLPLLHQHKIEPSPIHPHRATHSRMGASSRRCAFTRPERSHCAHPRKRPADDYASWHRRLAFKVSHARHRCELGLFSLRWHASPTAEPCYTALQCSQMLRNCATSIPAWGQRLQAVALGGWCGHSLSHHRIRGAS